MDLKIAVSANICVLLWMIWPCRSLEAAQIAFHMILFIWQWQATVSQTLSIPIHYENTGLLRLCKKICEQQHKCYWSVSAATRSAIWAITMLWQYRTVFVLILYAYSVICPFEHQVLATDSSVLNKVSIEIFLFWIEFEAFPNNYGSGWRHKCK